MLAELCSENQQVVNLSLCWRGAPRPFLCNLSFRLQMFVSAPRVAENFGLQTTSVPEGIVLKAHASP